MTSSVEAIEVDRTTDRPSGDRLLARPNGRQIGSLGRRVRAKTIAGARSMKRNALTEIITLTVAKASEAADGALRCTRVVETEALTTRISATTASKIHCHLTPSAAAELTSDEHGHCRPRQRRKQLGPAAKSAAAGAASTILQYVPDPWTTSGAMPLQGAMTKVLNPAAAAVFAMTAASQKDSSENSLRLNGAEEEEMVRIGERGRTALASTRSLLVLLSKMGQESGAVPSHSDSLDGGPKRGPSVRLSQSAAAEAEEGTLRPPRRRRRGRGRELPASPRTKAAVRIERSDGGELRKTAAARRDEANTWTGEVKDMKNALTFGMTDMPETMPTTKWSEATTERTPPEQATSTRETTELLLLIPRARLGPRTGGGDRRRMRRRQLRAAEPAASRAGPGSGTDPLTERSVWRMSPPARRSLLQTLNLRGSRTKTLQIPETLELQPSRHSPPPAAAPPPGSP